MEGNGNEGNVMKRKEHLAQRMNGRNGIEVNKRKDRSVHFHSVSFTPFFSLNVLCKR